jgi:uncharacterized protein
MLVYKEEGRSGVMRLLKRVVDFSRIRRKIWYLPVIFLMPVLYGLIYGVIYGLGLPLPVESDSPLRMMPIISVAIFIAAAGEEVGYMGYAVEPMQQQWGALTTAIIMGLIWAVWHYPSIIQQGHDATWIVWGTLGTVAVRLFIVWLYNNTGGSVFACIIFHSMANIGRILFPKDQHHNPLVDYPDVHYSLLAIVAVLVFFLWGSKTVARYKYT